MVIGLSKEAGYILHEKADQYYGQGAGFLSIKSFYNGQAHYTSGLAHHVIDDRTYLVLNHDQPYTIEIEAVKPVESFCVFFAPSFARMASHSLNQTIEQALDSTNSAHPGSLLFFDRAYPHDELLSPALLKLRRVCRRQIPETGWLVEQFHDLFRLLLQVHARTVEEVDAVPAARAATREELYRRLHYAKDYADALFATPVTLEQMAGVAGISPNHLLRTFRQVFHQSPYQYITARRLEHAQYLLRHTDQTVTEICLAVGFESLGAFSWLFRRRTGLSPRGYRLQNR